MSKGGCAADVIAWADVVQMEKVEKEDKDFAAMKAEYTLAEGIVEDAEMKYSHARLRVARELAKGLPQPSLEEERDKEEKNIESKVDNAEQEMEKQRGKPGAKNTSNLSGGGTWGETGQRRWLVARGIENRKKKADKKTRDLLRGEKRLNKMQQTDMDQEVVPMPVAEESTAKERAMAEVSKAKEAGSAKAVTTVEEDGAQLMANRIAALNESYRRALIKVTVGGEENVYALKPHDVVLDLRKRGVLAGSVADDMLNLLASPPTKAPPPPPADWVANAKKVNLTEEQPAPFEDAETWFLTSLDEKVLAEAEAELEAAEKALELAWNKAEEVGARMNDMCSLKGYCFFEEVKDEDPLDTELVEAEQILQSQGSKNASKNAGALPDKVVSSKRWEARRDEEKRARDAAKARREIQRAQQRNKRVDAIQMGDEW